jgi:aminomethyltransferase
LTAPAAGTALQTPLYEIHVAAGGQMVEFGGWMMPLQYSSMKAEHLAVRTAAGMFDVSHMGEFVVPPGAVAALDRVVSNRLDDLAVGQARYNIICTADGGILDDALVYHAGDHHLVIVNAGARNKDRAHFEENGVELVDATMDVALIAVQGPRAVEILQTLTDTPLDEVRYYHFVNGTLGGLPCGFSRTGYTGEDGFELLTPSNHAVEMWNLVMRAGEPHGLVPCGLGARDTLRLEASMRLSGQDIDESTNPLEAGLGWAVKLDKGEFVGRDALLRIRDNGPARLLIGLELDGRAIARHGYPILDGGRQVGEVTSGTFSFSLGKAVAMGYVERAAADSAGLTVEVRGEQVPARRAPMPFYKRQKGGS